MPELKLSRLPDRTPVKVTITLPPGLKKALDDYATLYGEVYGQAEPVHELIPAMLESFLEADRTFVRRRRELGSRSG